MYRNVFLSPVGALIRPLSGRGALVRALVDSDLGEMTAPMTPEPLCPLPVVGIRTRIDEPTSRDQMTGLRMHPCLGQFYGCSNCYYVEQR